MLTALEAKSDQFTSISELAQELQECIGSSECEALVDSTNSVYTLKSTLIEQIHSVIQTLSSRLQVWATFYEEQEAFQKWLQDAERRLQELSESDIEVDTPNKLQVGGSFLHTRKET